MHPNDGRVVSNFIVQALCNDPISIYGEGSQTRSFCCVHDMIEGFCRLMQSPDSITGQINLGNPREFTIRELAETVIELTGSNPPLPIIRCRQTIRGSGDPISPLPMIILTGTQAYPSPRD
jgi:UDP-glucuronate decarboxylase